MKTNEELQKDVQNAIKWEPLLHAAEIGVTAKDGLISLTGVVDSYAKKLEAETAARKVVGVKGVVEKIEIKFGSKYNMTDNDIAANALSALKLNMSVHSDGINVKVEKGWITLEGEQSWNYQREAATNAVNYLFGVQGVTNNITINTELHPDIDKQDIEFAFDRNWLLKHRNIQITILGNKVTLTGSVNTWYEGKEAERIAWNSPGVFLVDNKLYIDNIHH